MALTFTQADLDNLKAAFVSGALEVQIGDRLIKYRSQKDLVQALEMVKRAVEGFSSEDSPNVVQATFSKT